MENYMMPKISVLDDEDLLKEIMSRYKKCQEYFSEWNSIAKEDYQFALGEQWTDEEKQHLFDQRRPALTFNRIKPIINIVSGYQRENSSRIKVTPEGGEDRIFSEVFDKVLHAVDKWSKLSYKLGHLFDDGITCGKGFIEAILDYNKDPIRGELKFLHSSPYSIYVDPDCKEYDINEGAEYLFKIQKFTKQKLKEMYPSKKDVLDLMYRDTDTDFFEDPVQREGDRDNYGNDPNKVSVFTRTDFVEESDYQPDVRLTHKEYWYKKYVTKYFVIDIDSGEPVKFDTKEKAESYLDGDQTRKIFERKVPEMWVCAIVCGQILQKEKSPFEPNYSGFPFFRCLGEWSPSSQKEMTAVQGIVRQLKDPQKEKNKAKSQYLHILNTQSNSGWIGDEDALSAEGWKRLEMMCAVPGITIPKRTGKELREILPKGPNIAHLQREQTADNEFKQISGVNPDLLGLQEGTASGRAIALRVKQAVTSLVRLFSNYRYTKEIIGNFVFKMIPDLFDSKKIMKILGVQYMQSIRSELYPDGLTEGHIDAFLQMVKDMKYDVAIAEADNTSTLRFETLENLLELAKIQPIPIEIIMEYMDIPNKDEAMDKIKQEQQRLAALQQQAKQK